MNGSVDGRMYEIISGLVDRWMFRGWMNGQICEQIFHHCFPNVNQMIPGAIFLNFSVPHHRYFQNRLVEVSKGYRDRPTKFLHYQEEKTFKELGPSSLWPLKIALVREQSVSEYRHLVKMWLKKKIMLVSLNGILNNTCCREYKREKPDYESGKWQV